jgi:hypothetical protein
MTYYEWLAYAVYVGCVAPLGVLGLRVVVLWGWSLIKRWGTT